MPGLALGTTTFAVGDTVLYFDHEGVLHDTTVADIELDSVAVAYDAAEDIIYKLTAVDAAGENIRRKQLVCWVDKAAAKAYIDAATP